MEENSGIEDGVGKLEREEEDCDNAIEEETDPSDTRENKDGGIILASKSGPGLPKRRSTGLRAGLLVALGDTMAEDFGWVWLDSR